MASDEKFKKFLKSGTFSRWTQKYQTREAEFTTRETAGSVSSGQPVPEPAHVDVPGFEFEADQADVYGPEFLDQNEESDFDLEYWSPEEYSSDEDQEGQFYEDVQSGMEEEQAQPESLTTFMRNWSLEFNIPHQALQPLLQRLHQIDSSLPESPRRLLQTPRTKATIVAAALLRPKDSRTYLFNYSSDGRRTTKQGEKRIAAVQFLGAMTGSFVLI